MSSKTKTHILTNKSAIAGKQKADRNWTFFCILHGGALYFWDELRTCKETYWSFSGLLSFQGGKTKSIFCIPPPPPSFLSFSVLAIK